MSQAIHQRFDKNFMQKFYDITLKYLEETLKGEKPVVNFKLPEDLKKQIDFTISKNSVSENNILEEIKQIMQNQIRSYHPHFHNQLYGGFDQYSTIGNILGTCINGTMFTYEVAPVYTLMESYIYDHLRSLIGWATVDGMMTPGGSFANWLGMLLARHNKFPDARKKGIQGLPIMKLITSATSHYSIQKGAILEGFGTDNIVKVKCNQFDQMIPSQLEKEIQKIIRNGQVPLYVNSTAGTSVAGAIDPIQQIGLICKKYGIWHHVDGALGGAFLLSENLRHHLGDLTNVDSLSWDPHKALLVPQQVTFFLCKHQGIMQNSNSTKADYLFHKQRKSYQNSLDTGDKSLQCGRVIDILKVWFYFKGNGWNNIAKQIQTEHSLAIYVENYVKQRSEQWILVYPASTFTIGFYYVPKAMRNLTQNQAFFAKLSKITVQGKKIMIDNGKILVSYATNGRNNNYFWRDVMSNPFIGKQDVNYELNLISQYCQIAYSKLTD